MAGFYQWNASDMRSEVLQITYGVIYVVPKLVTSLRSSTGRAAPVGFPRIYAID